MTDAQTIANLLRIAQEMQMEINRLKERVLQLEGCDSSHFRLSAIPPSGNIGMAVFITR